MMKLSSAVFAALALFAMPAFAGTEEDFRNDVAFKSAADQDTYTYKVTSGGGLYKVCDSVGAPIPFSAFTASPVQTNLDPKSRAVVTPDTQSDGLFHPHNVDAFYIRCANPNTSAAPVWLVISGDFITTPFVLSTDGKFYPNDVH